MKFLANHNKDSELNGLIRYLTKIKLLANHNKESQSIEPIRYQSKNTRSQCCAGKGVMRAIDEWFQFLF